MTKAHYDTISVIETAMQIIKDEHRHFMNEGIENEDHVARIVRIAMSVGTLLQSSSRTKKEMETDIQYIIDYFRELLIHEWPEVIPKDNETTGEEDPIKKFDDYIKEYRESMKRIHRTRRCR